MEIETDIRKRREIHVPFNVANCRPPKRCAMDERLITLTLPVGDDLAVARRTGRSSFVK